MIKMSNSRRAVVLTAAFMAAVIPSKLQATPYASCITNNNGIIQFHLNEKGGTVVVNYEDSSVDPNFNGINTGTNLAAGSYSFNLTGHTTYSIAVTSFGTGAAHVVDNSTANGSPTANGSTNSFFIVGNLRGIDVNKNVTSPYFGRVYFDKGSGGTPAAGLTYMFNSDATFISSNTAGVAWQSGNSSSPYRMTIGSDDYLAIGDYSSAGAAVYRVTPDLTANQLLLGPVGDANGISLGVHGLVFSKPLLVGSLTGGGATLYEIDNDFPGSGFTVNEPNNILIFSGITQGALPWENPPVVGPEVGLNAANVTPPLSNVFPGLSQGPNGYFYASNARNNYAIPQVYVFDPTATTTLWNSLKAPGGPDYFLTDTGNGLNNAQIIDSAVSPDGKYLVGLAIDNHMTICALTNGIPDVSTFFTIKPPSYTQNGRGVAWDIADNIYTIGSGTALVQQWTLGQSILATTVGTAAGVTSFTLTPLIPVISLAASPFISQANTYGNPTNGFFTITRTGGNISSPLTVNFTYGGTASNGTYTAGSTGSVVLAAGQTTTNISIKAVTDGIPRLTTSLTLTVTPSPANYTLQGGSTAMNILNTATPYLIASVGAPSMYNAYSNDYATATILRLGDTNTTITVNNFTVAGTAVQGTDYTPPSPVTFNPGDLKRTTFVYPLVGGQLPVHSSTLPYSGNKSIVIGIGTGTGYTAAPSTATLTIVDSATPPSGVLYSDPLDNTTATTDTTSWTIVSANGNEGNAPTDVDVEFGHDLTSGSFPIPFPPNGSQYALKMTVNKGGGQAGGSANPMTAVNAYLAGHTFSGNYAVRFNMNVIETGNLINSVEDPAADILGYDNQEGPLMGINHNGTETNWWAGTGVVLGAAETSWTADGIFYWLSDTGGRYDNSAAIGQYRAFTGNGSPSTNTGWKIIGTNYASSFVNVFKTNVFTCYPSVIVPPNFASGWTEGGPGLPVNGSGSYGFSVSSWSDVEIKQLNGIVTLTINKTPIFSYANNTMFTSGQLMLGYEDPYDGGEDADTAVYYSNLRVVAIGAPIITAIAADNVHNTVIINFTVSDDTSNAFKVYGSSTVNGTYANVAGAAITSLSNGSYQAVVPQNGAMQFYRILQQ